MKSKLLDTVWDYFLLTVGICLGSIALYFFMMPSNVTIGSITGLAVVLSNFIPLPVSAIAMSMNVVLLIIGFLLIGCEFGIKTVYTSILSPGFIALFEVLFPNNKSFTNDQLLDVICYCVIGGVGLAILFARNASSGGLDIIAKIMNKYLRMDIGKAVGFAGMAVAMTSILLYDGKTVILSLLGTYFSGIVLDHFIFGSTIKRRVCILSKKYEEILDFVLHELHSGATKYHAYGTYQDSVYTELCVIVNKNEYMKLTAFISKIDPDAFVTVTTVNEVMYKPKKIEK